MSTATVRTRWTVLLNVIALPVGIIGYFAWLVGQLAEQVHWLCEDSIKAWKIRVRLWAGLTRDGLDPERVAANDAYRQQMIDSLRAPRSEQ